MSRISSLFLKGSSLITGIFSNSGSKCDLDKSDLPRISIRAMISFVPSYISSAAFASLCWRDRMISSSRSMLYRFLILYGLLYAGFGVQSPYLPILLDNRHLRPETIGLALAAGMAMRLMAAQAVARLADRLDAPKVILALCTNAALLAAAAPMPLGVPQLLATGGHARATPSQARGVGVLLRLSLYRKMVLLAMLILGSHAMHDSFAMIRWSRAG